MFGQLGSRVANWWLYRETVRELNFLDQHILKDIGFERTTTRDIKDCARSHTFAARK
jgi:uncharacterized protein YjiS (DUF1127 family)